MDFNAYFWLILAAVISSVYFLLIKYLYLYNNWIYLAIIIGLQLILLFTYYKTFKYNLLLKILY